ncbi:MAG: DUF485 domain-containing protein [Pseudomonadales bacterium]|nr:DUF485 domain-containing protein [Pseudomonadales bacterium]
MGELTAFAKIALAACFTMFLALLFGIPLFPNVLATPVFLGITWGYLLVIGIHLIPVVLAWTYIRQRNEEQK